MHIKCPHCSADNKIEFGENIVCGECKKSFAGHSYAKLKKPLVSATTALFIGVFGTYKADKIFFEEQRYPLSVEYELVDSCVNSSRMPMRSIQYSEKKKTCICALNKTMEIISYEELKESESEFTTRFKNSIYICN